ncbi:MAG: phosphoribosylformimino-5-aminoimidazole carboxamide ribotide isomerase [Archaeoglobi archaeon]|nr:phosphoribosylformimino-5-aminoimidazole carboxamide ribotide isomerase [Archaeoglobi archaeon]MDK2781570.1 phosphoribosylformimino-5-aminoimidazole carboxamide ribotide isomerase [Archaeoglobi archaeon]
MKFLVIPALDLKDGKCVQLVGGDPSKMIFSSNNPLEIAKKWEREGARMLHVVDLDRALGRGGNQEIVFRILKEVGIPVQLGGGIRSFEDAREFLESGVYRVILGTSAVLQPEIIERISSTYSSERVMVAVELRNRKVTIKGWRESVEVSPEEVLREAERRGAGSILFTSVDVEGRLSGVDTEALEMILELTELPVFYSGGVSSIEDIIRVKEAGASGVVIGSALYKGKISLKEAIEVVK